MRTIRYRPRAAFDLESIVVYLGEVQHAPAVAKHLYEELINTVASLSELPTLGKPFFDEAFDRKAFRSFLVSDYCVFYTFGNEALTVWRVIHTRQDIDDYALIDWE